LEDERGRREFLAAHPVRQAGRKEHLDDWIPAEDLAAFNDAIVGKSEVVWAFRQG
jgi:hypothetical protein